MPAVAKMLFSRHSGNVALYSTFSVFAFFGGTVANKIGLKPTLIIGASGYSLYIGALYSTVISQTQARENFVIAAGAILGVCAGLLWTAQGAIMLAYATERTKGRYVALFWSIFNLVSNVSSTNEWHRYIDLTRIRPFPLAGCRHRSYHSNGN